MAKNGHVHEDEDVDDLKYMSYKFGNDIFITFEMTRVAYNRPFWKNNIS